MFDIDFRWLFQIHVQKRGQMFLSACCSQGYFGFGALEHHKIYSLVAFKEKPAGDFGLVVGVCGVNRSVFAVSQCGKRCVSRRLMLDALKSKQEINGLPCSKYWLKIGRLLNLRLDRHQPLVVFG